MAEGELRGRRRQAPPCSLRPAFAPAGDFQEFALQRSGKICERCVPPMGISARDGTSSAAATRQRGNVGRSCEGSSGRSDGKPGAAGDPKSEQLRRTVSDGPTRSTRVRGMI
jgi:hypothetical protein